MDLPSVPSLGPSIGSSPSKTNNSNKLASELVLLLPDDNGVLLQEPTGVAMGLDQMPININDLLHTPPPPGQVIQPAQNQDILQRAFQAVVEPTVVTTAASPMSNVLTVVPNSDGILQLTREQSRALGLLQSPPPVQRSPGGPTLLLQQAKPQLQQSSIILTPVSAPQPVVQNLVQTSAAAVRPTAVRRKVAAPTRRPLILPKPPKQAAPLQVVSLPSQPRLGTPGNPIQLVKNGSTYTYLQNLDSAQYNLVTSALQRSGGLPSTQAVPTQETPAQVSSSAPTAEMLRKHGSDMVVVDPETKTRIIYKLYTGADDSPPLSPSSKAAKDAAAAHKKEVAAVTESEEDEMFGGFDLETLEDKIGSVETYYPHDFFQPGGKAGNMPQALRKQLQLLGNSRKRGRPRRGEKVAPRPEISAKRMKREFGLTAAQMQAVEKDLIADETLDFDNADKESSAYEPETPEVRTRSGRVTKPPVPKDETKKVIEQKKEPDVNVEDDDDKPRRKFTVPDRFRCRVCDKVYLGDRKMNKHMKLYPGHGGYPEKLPEPVPMASIAPVTVATTAVTNASPLSSLSSGSVIPMAKIQLEELVKNLDAELVLEVVASKLFNTFSLWQLQTKKMTTAGDDEKGLPRLTMLFDDLETSLKQTKRLVDACLTDVPPEGEDGSLKMDGPLLRSAIGVKEGPWYLPKNLSEQHRRLLGVQLPPPPSPPLLPPPPPLPTPATNVLMSPRSDSLHNEDSNSMMSTCSERGGGGGAQVVLERNLGARSLDIDEDTQEPAEMSEHEEEEEEAEEEEECEGEEEEGEEDNNLLHVSEVDPKKVLEQHGINISGEDDHHHVIASLSSHGGKKVSSAADTNTTDLVMEIDSLGPFPPVTMGEAATATQRLPAFSTIKPSNEDVSAAAEALLSSVVDEGDGEDHYASGPSSVPNTRRSSVAVQIDPVLRRSLEQMSANPLGGGDYCSGPPSVSQVDIMGGGGHQVHSSGPPSVMSVDAVDPQGNNTYSTHQSLMATGPSSVASVGGPPSVGYVTQADILNQQMQSSGPSSVISVGGPPSVDQSSYNVQMSTTGPSSVASVGGPPSVGPASYHGPASVASVGGPPSVGPSSYSVMSATGPPSVASVVDQCIGGGQQSNLPEESVITAALETVQMSNPPSVVTVVDPVSRMAVSGPPSVATVTIEHQSAPIMSANILPQQQLSDVDYVMHGTPLMEFGPHLPSSPCMDYIPMHPQQHISNPASIDHRHQSIPNSPMSEVDAVAGAGGSGSRRSSFSASTPYRSHSSVRQQNAAGSRRSSIHDTASAAALFEAANSVVDQALTEELVHALTPIGPTNYIGSNPHTPEPQQQHQQPSSSRRSSVHTEAVLFDPVPNVESEQALAEAMGIDEAVVASASKIPSRRSSLHEVPGAMFPLPLEEMPKTASPADKAAVLNTNMVVREEDITPSLVTSRRNSLTEDASLPADIFEESLQEEAKHIDEDEVKVLAETKKRPVQTEVVILDETGTESAQQLFESVPSGVLSDSVQEFLPGPDPLLKKQEKKVEVSSPPVAEPRAFQEVSSRRSSVTNAILGSTSEAAQAASTSSELKPPLPPPVSDSKSQDLMMQELDQMLSVSVGDFPFASALSQLKTPEKMMPTTSSMSPQQQSATVTTATTTMQPPRRTNFLGALGGSGSSSKSSSEVVDKPAAAASTSQMSVPETFACILEEMEDVEAAKKDEEEKQSQNLNV